MTAEQANLFYDEMRKAFIKSDSNWNDKATIFRNILEEFFKAVTKECDWPTNSCERIDAYYDTHPEEEEMREGAHKIRKKLNRSVHGSLEFATTHIKHTTLCKEDIREVYETLVLIIFNATQVIPDSLTFELLGVNTTDYLSGLNDQQKDAVLSDARVLFVNAGPGTGKTTLLVQRMIHSVLGKQPLNKIVALSFTNTAAKQLKDKFQKQAFRYLKDKEYELFSGTIHSYCLRNLRKYEKLKGTSFNYMIISDEELLEFSPEVSTDLNYKYTIHEVSNILATNPNIWPQDIKTAIENIKRKNNLISLNDILSVFYDKLKSDVDFATWILQSAELLVIDEAQDLNEYNFKIFEIMMELKPTLKLFLVGDPRQNIFEFNGGSYKHLADFLAMHEKDSEVKNLSTSYRCPSSVLNFVNSFNFKDCPNISLHSDISGEIMMRPYPTIEDESQSVTDTLNEIDDFDSCAVISANIKGLNNIIDKLNESKIPFIVHGGRRRLKIHIRYINNLLKVILNNDIKSIRAVAKVLDLDIRTQPLGTPKHFSEKELFIRTALGRNLYTLSKDYNRLEWSFSTLVSALIDKFLPSAWHDDANIQEDFNKLRLFSAGYKSVKEYIDAFAINKDRFMCFYDKDFKDCLSPLDGPCVTLSTIHSAKGLEWKNVFIIGMNDHNFPGIKKYDNKNMSQHETYLNRKRKELFVACTRSAGMLHISYPTNVEGEEQTPSMLLAGLEQQ